jgi:hypothetical protein
MKDIRSALAAAMHSQTDTSSKEAKPVDSADEEHIEIEAAQPEQDARRSGRRGRGRMQPDLNKEVDRRAPRNWTRADKQAFKALPEPTQDFILRQCRSIETKLGEKSEHLAAFHREYEPVAKILEPFAEKLKELNLTPQAAIQRYVDVERRLAAGDGVGVIKALVDSYQVPPDQLIEALYSRLADTQLNPGQLDRQQSTDPTRHAAALHDFELQLAQFKTAEDNTGGPWHPHYADVEPEMAALALAYSTRGRTIPPLKELYQMAVWANPTLRKSLAGAQQIADEASHEPNPAFTSHSLGRSLRDEILAHVDGA